MVHITQIEWANAPSTNYALCCDGSVRMLVISDADRRYGNKHAEATRLELQDSEGDCGPGCVWVKAARDAERDAQQAELVKLVQAAGAAQQESNVIAAQHQATVTEIKDATLGSPSSERQLLDAYRKAWMRQFGSASTQAADDAVLQVTALMPPSREE